MTVALMPGEEARLLSTTTKSSSGTGHSIWKPVMKDLEARLVPHWQAGESPLLSFSDDQLGFGDDAMLLSALIKAEMRARFERHERPDANEYLARFPLLRSDRERVVSVVYEEYCLREENGCEPNPESFCARYPEWSDSLASQLRYHRLLSQVVGAPTQPHYPKPGELFAERFRLRSVLGQGAAARVYLAEQPELGDRAVALKLSRARSKEPSIQGRLDHAHIVPVWSVIDDEESGLRGLCMPYRPGIPLDVLIRLLDPKQKQPERAGVIIELLASTCKVETGGPTERPGWRGFPLHGSYCDAAAWIIIRIARALNHAHANGVMHRDVKPANILVTQREGPQLLDFNLAHDPHSASQAETALRGGTLPYMAPEQLRAFLDPENWKLVGPPADVFSLGLVLDELITGDRPAAQPVDEASLPRLINDMLDERNSPRSSTRERAPRTPHALTAIISKCLAPDPKARYTRAEELAEDLERFLARLPLKHAVNPCRREALKYRFWRSRHALFVGATALLLVLGVVTVQKLLNPKPDEATQMKVALDRTREMERLLEQQQTAELAGAKAQASQKHAEAAAAKVRADRLYVEVLERSPASYHAWLGRAHLAFMFDKDATTAIDYYNRALKIMDERGVPASEYHRPLNSRAIVHISLGRAVQGSEKTATSASLRQSRSHFQRALDDLQRIDELIEKAGLELKSDELVRLDLFSARAHLGIGDAATGGYRQPEEALRQYLLGLEECSRARATLQVLKPNPDQGISRSSIEGCTQSLKALSSDLESHAEDVRKELGLPAVEAAITRSH